jgi:hypothetical protein
VIATSVDGVRSLKTEFARVIALAANKVLTGGQRKSR